MSQSFLPMPALRVIAADILTLRIYPRTGSAIILKSEILVLYPVSFAAGKTPFKLVRWLLVLLTPWQFKGFCDKRVGLPMMNIRLQIVDKTTGCNI